MADKTVELKLGFEGNLKKVKVKVPANEARPWDADSDLKVVGKPMPRVDGREKVSGQALYTFDVALPGLLHGAVLRSPHPAATVKSIDLEPAKKMSGVKAVMAVAKAGERVVFAGQDIAAVAADRPEQAQEALRAIKVEYETRPFVVDTASAAKEGAPKVHLGAVKERRTEGDEPDTGGAGGATQGNVRPGRPMKKGDVKRGFKAAAHVVEQTYTTPVQTHSALETHGLVVRWDSPKKMTVWASTQSIFSIRDEMAEIFGLQPSDVDVITEAMGGGFGAKFGPNAAGTRLGTITGELARMAKAPVKLMCTRHDEHVCTGNRPDSIQHVKIGADRRGKLTAIQVEARGSAGTGTGAGVGRNAFAIYSRCKNALVDARDVYTNAGPGTAMRAPGHPQGAFALELALDELAAKAGIDPIDLRLKHDEHPVRLHQLEMGRKKFDWDAKRAANKALRDKGARIRTGTGVAVSIWGDFGRPRAAVATVSVMRDGLVEVRNGVQDIGGGIPIILAQIAAEVFARPMDRVRIKFGHSEYGSSVGSGGSHTTSSVSPAVRNAAEQAKIKLTEVAATALGVSTTDEVTWNADGSATSGGKTLSFDEVCRKMEGESITATADRPPTYGNYPSAFMGRSNYQIAGVQFADVTVDTWTGVVTVPRVLAIHDAGRVMNPLTLRSQVNGGVILGTSYALFEQRVMDRASGRMLNPNLEQYKMLGAKDLPDIEAVFTEVHTGNNNTGAVGIGEPSTIPTAACIATAVFDAVGAPVRDLPLTPDRVLAALASQEKAG